MTSRHTPLLAQDDDDDTPAMLSGGPPNGRAMEEESALSRLIAESSALMPFSSSALDETTQSTTYDTALSNAATSRQQHQAASFTTMCAGSFIVLQWGFIWGAYFSKSWMDIHLQVLIEWQQKFLPWFNHHTDVVLEGMSVFTLSQNLKEDHEYFSLAGLWFCSVVLPCIFMIVCPIWILTDYSQPPLKRSVYPLGQPLSRLWLELTIRLSLLAVFIHMALNVAISGIQLHWEDTDLQVHCAFKGPYISYLLGCTCAMISVVVLRMPYLEHLRLLSYPNQKPQRNPRLVAASPPDPIPPQAQRAPPANAFRLPWLNSNNSANAVTADEGGEAEADTEAQQQRRPLLENGQHQHGQEHLPHKDALSTWKNFLLFQLGFLSFVLWFPALALPQFRVLFSGLIMEMIKVPAFNVYVWQLPRIVWQSGIHASTPIWIMLFVGILLTIFTLLLPITALIVAARTWWLRLQHQHGHAGNHKWWRDLLILLHPTLCGIPMAAGLIATVGAFIDIGEDIDDDICTQIEHIVEDQCLISGGVIQWGAYFLLAQAVCLEAFVMLTLWFTAPPQPPTNTV